MTADVVVVGQGLAGSAVAWHLRWRGCRVVVVDRGDVDSASRVAAGLVTPFTGKRFARTAGFDELYPAAVAFYRRVEAEAGRHVFAERPAVRLFVDDAERAKFGARFAPAGVNPARFVAPFGGVELAPAGRLDVPAYLSASRAAFAADGGFVAADLDPGRDVMPEPDGVWLPRLNLRAKTVVFCQGYAGRANPWFPDIAFNPARGEVLKLRIPGLTEERVVHRGIWLAPVNDDVFLAGSTYDRDHLTPTPSAGGRDEITDKVRAFLRLPFEVIDHRAAVRPIVNGKKPVFGIHPDRPQIAYFNGLGSKGVLTSPTAAAALVTRLAC